MSGFRWRPPKPEGNLVKVVRDDQTEWVGFIDSAEPSSDGTQLHFEGREAIGLLDTMPMPWPVPRPAGADRTAAYEHWWRQLVYVFNLDNPREFPPLIGSLNPDGVRAVDRFARTALALGGAAVVTGDMHITVNADDDEVDAAFPALDVQAGFAVLFRQCHSPQESASFPTVWKVLNHAANKAHPDSCSTLREWRAAARRLRRQSLRSCVLETFANREGWEGLRPEPATPPDEIIRVVQYGDLLHWGDTRDHAAHSCVDPIAQARDRFEFFDAAMGLVHLYVGFALLAEAALNPGLVVADG